MKMQSNFLYALSLFMMTSFGIVSAQSSTVVGPEFGIKGGVNMSNLYSDSDDINDENVLWGFNAGVFAAFPIADNIFIQPEILYTTKGAELEYDTAGVEGTSKFKLGYVEVPLLVRFNLTDNFNIHVGGYASYLVNAKVTGEGDVEFDEDLDADDFERFDAGLSAGVGLDFNPISIGLRYNYGLTTIGKERDVAGTSYTFPDVKNSNLSLYLAYKLN
ncbi:porin family protein [Flavobacterium hydrophilum]|uniref:PorT family protein n=1 Tax=Flavobacterium hydrophilum TaxID=2211445 RepID=A0A2V4C5C7_9FLAO|nr:porin family protein [Flavobacterium hydrophilum]PXY46556.1 PorT family protein [Flavobacterium hydrophilum]